MASTASILRPGETLGGFEIEDVIGIGGMAIVYRARQVSLGRPVALKVLSNRLTSDEVFRERFRREGTHAATLEHPNIVPVYDFGEQEGFLYIAMRLVEGTNLAELILERGLTADGTIELLRPIASALDTAHAAGLIHRDVKPQNVLITAHGHPYLADFGVAKGSNTYGLTATGGFVGSVNYASPEQIEGLTLTPASDVYALTAVLFQCLTGEVPYPRETDAGVMHAHLHDPPPTLPGPDGVGRDFHSVLARGMAKDPGSRYGHAGDLITAAALCVGRMRTELRTSVPAFPPRAGSEESAGSRASARRAEVPPGSDAGRAEAGCSGTEILSAEELAVRADPKPTTVDRHRPPLPPAVEAPRPGRIGRLLASAPNRRSAPGTVEQPAAQSPATVALAGTASSREKAPDAAPEVSAAQQRPSAEQARREPRASGRRRTPWFALAAVLAVGAVGGVLIAITGESDSGAKRFTSGHLALVLGPQWHSAAPRTPLVGLEHPVILRSVARWIEAGAAGPPGELAAAAPAAAVHRYGAPTRETTVQLPLGPARRYDWTRAWQGGPISALVVATAGGELAIVCGGSPQVAGDACTGVEVAARIEGTAVEHPAPDPSLQGELRAALATRASMAAAIAAGRSLRSRSGPLGAVAVADGRALATLASVQPARYRADTEALRRALGSERLLSSSLAAAARTENRVSYASLRARVKTVGAGLRAAVAALEARGFSLPSLVALEVPAVPPRSRPHKTSPPPRQPTPTAAPEAVAPAPSAVPTPTPSPPPSPRPHPKSGEEELVTEPK